MSYQNRIIELFGTQYPIVQAGMVWCSGWRLASAVSNSGALGLLGAGSMYPEFLGEQIKKTKAATSQPFGVNLPLLYPDIDKHIDVILSQGVKIVFTSAGNPATWTPILKAAGITVVHVVSSLKFALKAEEAGADAVVGEGFEAGGHNGREETTTFCLIPMLKEKLRIPIIAAGGLYSGRSMLAAFALGAEGVQMGSRFAVSEESSAHNHFKECVFAAKEGDTELILKKLTPVRVLKSPFYREVKILEEACAPIEVLASLLGKGRSKKGILEGNLEEGELEIGQISALLQKKQSAKEIVEEVWTEFQMLRKQMAKDEIE
jgi:enoyl-[acyl-carrier protein] reductase II